MQANNIPIFLLLLEKRRRKSCYRLVQVVVEWKDEELPFITRLESSATGELLYHIINNVYVVFHLQKVVIRILMPKSNFKSR
jgi:hypothetical protein